MRMWTRTRVPMPVPIVIQRFLLQSSTLNLFEWSFEWSIWVHLNTLFMQLFAVSWAHYVALGLGIS